MDCQQIVDLVMKKASKDKEFKKKLIENSEQAILDETGAIIPHKLRFFEADDGNLSFEVIEQTVSDEDLEKLAGGVNVNELNEDQLNQITGGIGKGKTSKIKIKVHYPDKWPPHIYACDYACPSMIEKQRHLEELRKIFLDETNPDQTNNE